MPEPLNPDVTGASADPAVAWSVAGKTCLVTGATSGIGEETALDLARRGARVAILARSEDRAAATVERIEGDCGVRVEVVRGDLGSLESVRIAAKEILDRFEVLHVLVNNAGVIHLSRTTTGDGYETTFAVNHLGPFLLTNLLLDRIVASAPGRIVNVASDAHRFARGGIDLGDLQSEGRYRAFGVYGRSKAANILFTVELARRLEGTGVVTHAVHPGAVATRLGTNNGLFSRFTTAFVAPFFKTPAQGAATTLHVVNEPGLAAESGRYFANSKEARCAAHSRDPEVASKLWGISRELVGLGVE